MSTLKWNYLGCYAEKGDGTPVIAHKPIGGTKNQATCYQEAQNNKFFALQTSRGDNCFTSDDLNGMKVEDKYCSSTCSPYDELTTIDGRPGCGDINSRPDGFFGVYKNNSDMTPASTLVNRKDLLIDNSIVGEKFKNGLYKFTDSTHAWQWDAKRAFDGDPLTYWHSPYGFGSTYSMDRSKNYTKDGYVNLAGKSNKNLNPDITQLGQAKYNMRQVPFEDSRRPDRSNPHIVHATPEIKLSAANQRVHYGEWIQIELPFQIQLTGYELSPAKLNPRSPRYEMQRFPKFYVVLGSNDGENWFPLHSETNHKTTVDIASSMSSSGLGSNNDQAIVDDTKWDHKVLTEYPFKIFRMVIKETNGHRAAAISEWKLYGKICVDLGGACKTFDTSAIEALKANAMNMGVSSIGGPSTFENFKNMDSNPDEIIEESFMNTIEDIDNKDVIKELGVFDTSYSKY